MNQQKISTFKAISIFGGATVYFYLLLFTLFPFLKSHYFLNPAVYWFITGYFLFIPIFLCAIILVRSEGNKSTNEVLSALNIKAFSKRDWKYVVLGTLLAFILTGVVFGISSYLNKQFGLRMLNTQPWFLKMNSFQGNERLLLLLWLPMFLFNMLGEELLWRGYIQARMKIKYSWLLSSLLWMCFHLPFGFDLIIMLIPFLIIIPYVFYKTNNTSVGILIHTIYNGPIFVLIALGLN